MQLHMLRRQFVELSGRYDLMESVEGTEECKADLFLNAGVRLLDRKVTARHVQNSVAVHQVPPDVPIVHLERCWQVHEVWVLPVDGSGRRRQLCETRQTNRFQKFFKTDGVYDRTRLYGVPTYYATLTTRNEQQIEKLEALAANVPANYMHTGEWNAHILCIELYPHHHALCDIEVRGKFYSPPLIEGYSTNIWANTYPELLVKAACQVLEVFYRNTEGANDWMNSIMDELIDIEKMEVETDVRQYSVMEG